ncbi:MarR family winged helix-turn-helix transcriptional regulator [Homoserinibacter sp. YIM 151385]|uniref:MarR family winged helix-turn-helix transcriptional regulator n=1 Tax=Homoserinibacter sp. YIM 151385 TaxID=2985506 RepID=UPI0022F142DD|nr:MarR family winged helix-turn-helix transcriptional regulator [Homoserinibacter sp. YIM 151385]WBU38208.1 MarR family winged helix-turn-helix transcriptional regulator [Homoserinibacter sp. YIM 151385]
MADAPRTDTPSFSPTIAMLTLTRVLELRVAEILEPHGLTLRRYGLLGHVAGTPGISLSELARRSGITVQSVHTAIGSLQDAGLLRSVVKQSGIAADLTATVRGSEVLREIASELAELDGELFEETAGMRELSAALVAVTEERTPSGMPED